MVEAPQRDLGPLLGVRAVDGVPWRVCGQSRGVHGGQASRLGWAGVGAWQTQSPLAADLTRQHSVCVSQARLPDFIKVALGLNFKTWPWLQRQPPGQGSYSPGVPPRPPTMSPAQRPLFLGRVSSFPQSTREPLGNTGPAGGQRSGLRWSGVSSQTRCPQRAAGLRGERLGTPFPWTWGRLPCREVAPEGPALSVQSGRH